jgi:peptide/nickel transport system substrate-binding protein
MRKTFYLKSKGFGCFVFVFALVIFCPSLLIASQPEAKTFHCIVAFGAQTIDPHDTADFGGIALRDNMFDGLTRYRGNPGALEPWLATSWKASPDARQWTFQLRKGVLFHDRSEMTSDDVVYSIEKILSNAKGFAGTLSKFVEPGSTKALDMYTVQFNLKQSCGLWDILSQFIYVVNKKVLQRHEEKGDYGNRWLAMNGTRLGADGVGTGAYVITQFQPGQFWECETFPHFWAGWSQPHMKKVRMTGVYEQATRIVGLKNGTYHYWNQPQSYDDVQELIKSPLMQEVHFTWPKLNYVHLNNRKPPTSDIHFRKALNYAFDYDTLNKAILKGYAERNIGYIPNSINGALDPGKDFHYVYDLDKARSELARCKIDYKQHEPLEILIYQSAEYTTMAEMLLSALEKLGVKGRVRTVTWPGWVQEVAKPETAPHIGPMGLSPYYFDPDHWARLADPLGFGTHMGASWYENPEVTELHMKALSITNIKEKAKLYQQAQRIELQDASHIWVHQMNYHNALHKDIGGLENYSPYGCFQMFRELYFKSEWNLPK